MLSAFPREAGSQGTTCVKDLVQMPHLHTHMWAWIKEHSWTKGGGKADLMFTVCTSSTIHLPHSFPHPLAVTICLLPEKIPSGKQEQRTHQEEESVFQVLVRLDAAILGPLVVDSARGVEEGHVAIPACAQVDLLQLQLVGGVQVLFRVPEHAPVQDLPWGGQDKEGQVKFPNQGNTARAECAGALVSLCSEGFGLFGKSLVCGSGKTQCQSTLFLQGCKILKMSCIAVEEAKPHLGFALSSPGNGSCEGRNTAQAEEERGKSYPWKKPLCNPFLPETFPIWWGPLEKPSRCYRAETLCSGSKRLELGGLSAGRQSGSKTWNWDKDGNKGEMRFGHTCTPKGLSLGMGPPYRSGAWAVQGRGLSPGSAHGCVGCTVQGIRKMVYSPE